MPSSSTRGVSQVLHKEKLRVLVVVRDHISGLLQAVPCLRALRGRFPASTIMLLANPFATSILEGCPYIDEIIPFYQFSESKSWNDRVASLALKVRALTKLYRRVDLVIHLRFVGGNTLAFCQMLGTPLQVGFSQGRFDNFLDINLGHDIAELDTRTRNAAVLTAIGIEVPSQEMEVWLRPSDIEWSHTWLRNQGWHEGEPLIAFHPSCHWGCNEWQVERWTELGNEVSQRFQSRIVITGTGSERPMAEKIAKGMIKPPIIASGHTNLLQFAALLSRTTAVIAVDTAPTQICQALRKPAVVLMGAGNPTWNGPLASEPMVMLQKLSAQENVVEHCDFAAGTCHTAMCHSRLGNIRVQDVLSALETLIANPNERDLARLPDFNWQWPASRISTK